MPNNMTRVERLVAQRHDRRQRDDVAAEQRQLHARAALRDAVAHGRHAARNLRGGTGAGVRRRESLPDKARRADAPTACRCTR